MSQTVRVAVKPFAALLDLIAHIDDPRRAEGKMYRLSHVVLFAILAALAGANSLRSVETFMAVHLKRLRRHFDLTWKRAPAHTTIRSILLHLDPGDVERAFRRHAAALAGRSTASGLHVAIDGKTLRGSFDSFEDRKAAHVLSAFASGLALTLAHLDCGEKSNEIPAVQQLVKELGLPPGALITVDAMHCQKKPSRPPPLPAIT